MTLLRGADEVIMRSIEHLGHTLELGRVAVGELARRKAFLTGRLQHLDAVLVRPGKEHHFLAIEALKPGQRVRCDQLICMTDMRTAVRIGNGGGDVEFFAWHETVSSL